MSDVTKLLALYEQGVIDGEVLNASLRFITSTPERPPPAPRVNPPRQSLPQCLMTQHLSAFL